MGQPRDLSQGTQNEYKIEVNAITDETIQQIEELALSNACAGGIDIQNTINRIGIFQVISCLKCIDIHDKCKSYIEQLAFLYS